MSEFWQYMTRPLLGGSRPTVKLTSKIDRIKDYYETYAD